MAGRKGGAEGDPRTVAYVPSPSFSSCWNELGCRLPSMVVRWESDYGSVRSGRGGGGSSSNIASARRGTREVDLLRLAVGDTESSLTSKGQ